ncbi:(2Fe-2S)-binding domain protein [Tepidicaulis marinus]|uniref:(2Fe-2S)-binding domain protein n=1 Tax=Tepidicaulis marinus TaxID=1333998 RepID=A0A081B804_9HYPH|nr:hypothetical protein [Tepidicaulis marinus]GAK44172.1 (2Fe-2S)-binding domain protein [Tepidicaulis marinus]
MTAHTRLPLTARQITLSAFMGAVLWLFAALLLRFLAPLGIYEGMNTALLYALIIPGTVPFLFVVKKIAGLGDDQFALGIAVATAAATLLDGLALAFTPALYGTSVDQTAGAGAAILWGAGVGLVLGMIFNKSAAR